MAGLGQGVNIKVSTEELKATAAEVQRNIDEVRRMINEIDEYIGRSDSFWEGEAGDKHRSMYKKKRSDFKEIVRRFEEHPRDLLEIAGVYEKTEAINVEIAGVLMGDIIE